ncbi:ParA family protein [Fusibacillus kribbianus]|uniref:ParA family protein n=1 Tax=Fusibacillus kribbianus TaxID=3044208 RepID=A0AAP4BAM8_9FIRM|nr:ParA family protein [Ruminococcus sp. YH-rum2234]MDI9242327.1 ParA family protein [Ruminococcus sp. YH-rum2234]
MAITISVLNNKGGTGKTTSVLIISQLLAYLGKKVLVVDFDSQANSSMSLGHLVIDTSEVISGMEAPKEPNIAELMKGRYRTKEDVMSVIYPSSIAGIDLIPASKRHKQTPYNILFNTSANNNVILKRALQTVREDYDYILIDNAPADDILTTNSLYASDFIICPANAESYSRKGIEETLDNVLRIKEDFDIPVTVKGVYITRVESNTVIFRAIYDELCQSLGDMFFRTYIAKDVKASEAISQNLPILQYCPSTRCVFDYAKLLLEMDILNETDTLCLKKSIGMEE